MGLIPLYNNSFLTDELIKALSDTHNNEDGYKFAWVEALKGGFRSYGCIPEYSIHPCGIHKEDGTIKINFLEDFFLRNHIDNSYVDFLNIAIEAKQQSQDSTDLKAAFAQRVLNDWEMLRSNKFPSFLRRTTDVVCVLKETEIRFLYTTSENSKIYWNLFDYFDENYDICKHIAPYICYKEDSQVRLLCRSIVYDSAYKVNKTLDIDLIVKKLITDCIINKYGNKSGRIA